MVPSVVLKDTPSDKAIEQEENITPTIDVASLTATEKVSEAFKRAMALLPEAIGQQLKAIFTPAAIASMVAVFGAYVVLLPMRRTLCVQVASKRRSEPKALRDWFCCRCGDGSWCWSVFRLASGWSR